MLKILVSARDAGSAGHMLAIIEQMRVVSNLEFVAYADSPAFELMARHIREVRHFPRPAAVRPTENDSRRLVREARRIIEDEAPDAVLVGVSHSNEAGLDEAFLAAAVDRPTFAVQDYWGDVNLTLRRPAGLYFALDAVAVELTRLRHGVSAIACGSPKHSRYAALDPVELRSSARARLRGAGDAPVVGFFGQALSSLAGYRRVIAALCRSVSEAMPDARVIYRPHPRESGAEITSTLDTFARVGLDVTCVRDGTTEEWLAASDVVTSCFSSCVYDSAFLNRYSPFPVNAAVYLLFDPMIDDYFRQVTDLDVPPPARLGLAKCVSREEDLASALRDAVLSSSKAEMWERARRVLPAPERSSQDILDIISREVYGSTSSLPGRDTTTR